MNNSNIHSFNNDNDGAVLVVQRAGGRDRVALGLAAILAAAATFSVGAAASFTSGVAAPQVVSTGTVELVLGATGASTNRLSVAASDVAPGDTIQRTVDLVNNGSIDLASISLDTQALATSLLDTDTVDGLQMTIESCSVAWVESGASPAYTATCPAVQSTLVASRPVIVAGQDLAGVDALTAGETSFLKVTLELPQAAGNEFQGLTSEVEYAFSGIQRAGTDR